jgi:hypothetical protein
MNMHVNVTIKNRSGKVVNNLSVLGSCGVERIWRELFVSLLACGANWDKNKAETIDSIELSIGLDH